MAVARSSGERWGLAGESAPATASALRRGTVSVRRRCPRESVHERGASVGGVRLGVIDQCLLDELPSTGARVIVGRGAAGRVREPADAEGAPYRSRKREHPDAGRERVAGAVSRGADEAGGLYRRARPRVLHGWWWARSSRRHIPTVWDIKLAEVDATC